mgnify:CR=1 FL=1
MRDMHRGFNTFMKGMGTGAVIGMAVATSVSVMHKNGKGMKKKLGHAMKSASDIIENVAYMLK